MLLRRLLPPPPLAASPRHRLSPPPPLAATVFLRHRFSPPPLFAASPSRSAISCRRRLTPPPPLAATASRRRRLLPPPPIAAAASRRYRLLPPPPIRRPPPTWQDTLTFSGTPAPESLQSLPLPLQSTLSRLAAHLRVTTVAAILAGGKGRSPNRNKGGRNPRPPPES